MSSTARTTTTTTTPVVVEAVTITRETTTTEPSSSSSTAPTKTRTSTTPQAAKAQEESRTDPKKAKKKTVSLVMESVRKALKRNARLGHWHSRQALNGLDSHPGSQQREAHDVDLLAEWQMLREDPDLMSLEALLKIGDHHMREILHQPQDTGGDLSLLHH